MLQPSKTQVIHLGDSFSDNQAWTEGALYTAQKISKLINL